MSKLSKVTNGLLFDDDFTEQTLMWSLSPSEAAMLNALEFTNPGIRLRHTDKYLTYTITEPDRKEYSAVFRINHIPYDDTDIAGVIVAANNQEYAECQSYYGDDGYDEERPKHVIHDMVMAFENDEPYEYDVDHAVYVYENDESIIKILNLDSIVRYVYEQDWFQYGDINTTLYHYIKFNKVGSKFNFWASPDSYNWIEVGNARFDHACRFGFFLYPGNKELTDQVREFKKLDYTRPKNINPSDANVNAQQIDLMDFYQNSDIEGTGWGLVPEERTFIQRVNTESYEKIISHDKIEAYVERITLKSTDSDNDGIGCVIGYIKSESGDVYELDLIVNMGGGIGISASMPTISLVFNYGQWNAKLLKCVSLKNDITSSVGWNSINGVTLYINRGPLNIRVWHKYDNDNAWINSVPGIGDDPTIIYEFNEDDNTDIFSTKATSFGFGTHSQQSSFYETVIMAEVKFQDLEYETIDDSYTESNNPNSKFYSSHMAIYEDKYLTIKNVDDSHELEIYDYAGQIVLRTDDVAYRHLFNRSKFQRQIMINTTTLPMPIRKGKIRLYEHDSHGQIIGYYNMAEETYGGDIYELSRRFALFIGEEMREVDIINDNDLGVIDHGEAFKDLYIRNDEDYVLTNIKISIKAYSEFFNGEKTVKIANDGEYNNEEPLQNLHYQDEITIDKLKPGVTWRFYIKLDQEPLIDFYNVSHDYRFKIVIE